jgi:tyrosine-protein kinase Etk/Wzc
MRLLKAGRTGNVRMIDNAVVPEQPVKPKRSLVLALFVLVGVMLGVGAALVRKFMFGGIDDANEIEEHTGLAVYASVPSSAKQASLYEKIQAKASGMFVLENVDTNDAAIESLRSFRTALQFAMLDAKNNRVMITGATPGVGKSFVSVNTAAVLAASGKCVLLIDLDMRKGHINQYLGLTRDNGMAELLAGEQTFDQVVRRNILPNLDFIPTGALPSAPHLLLQHGNLKQFLEKVSAEYDLVLLDTPPVLAVTDATMLSEHVGTCILVAREGTTTLGELIETVKRFTQAGAKASGVVFNAVRPRPGKYGYKYGVYKQGGN